MTFWATLYYTGYVVTSLGGFDTLAQCEELTSIMMSDIVAAYTVPVTELETSMFPTNEFTVDCTSERMEIDERYTNDP
jgi:hypothetical protein